MSTQREALETELATVLMRLDTDTGDRLNAAKRRIIDVEAAIELLPPDPVEDDEVEVEAAVVEAPQNAMKPKASPSGKRK